MAIKVYIDQGHNPERYNTGAVGNGLYEQDITFTVGRMLYNLLEADENFTPRLSRPTEDVVLGNSNSDSLRARVEDANSWGADLFLSIHTNAAANPEANGTEALVYSPDSTVSVAVGTDILDALHRTTGLRNRGLVYRPGLYVLRRTAMPAVLVELGFITNPAEAALMEDSPALFSQGIYRGLLQYYG